MKVCDIVLNSIWFDPRVTKQLSEYIKFADTVAIGLKCVRYDEKKVNAIPCKTNIIQRENVQRGGFINTLISSRKLNKRLANAIISEKPDIIHANDLTALIPAYYAAKKLKCRLIYDSHEVFLDNIGLSNSKLHKLYYSYFEKKIVKKCDLMVSVSNAAAEYFAETYKIRKPLVVTNCIPMDRICEKKPDNGKFEVLNHGMFYEGRGYSTMAQAAKLLKGKSDICFAIRGFGKLEESLRKYVSDNKLDNFKFYPPVNVQELVSEAASSSVGVAITEPINLNFKLSVSNKLFEYAAAGLPVIMSDIPEHRYLNNKYKFGIIIKSNTPQALSDAVLKLYEDNELYMRCAENAAKLAREINWETEFKKLLMIERSWFDGKK